MDNDLAPGTLVKLLVKNDDLRELVQDYSIMTHKIYLLPSSTGIVEYLKPRLDSEVILYDSHEDDSVTFTEIYI